VDPRDSLEILEEKYFPPARSRNPDLPAHIPATRPTTPMLRLQF